MATRRVRRAIGFGSTAFVAYKSIKAYAALSNEDHDDVVVQRRPEPGDKPHGHLLGSRYFKNKDGLYIHWRCWPSRRMGNAGRAVLLAHGFGEHIGRYECVAAALNEQGFAVYGLDHQGHGCSEGDRAYVKHGFDMVDDIIQFAREIVSKHSDRIFLLGHSMGGLLSVLSAMREPDLWQGVALSGPCLKVNPDDATPFKIWLAKTLSAKLPKLELDGIDAAKVSRSSVIVDQYKRDPLTYHGGVRVRFAAEFLDMLAYVDANKSSFKLPLLIQHGTADTLCMIEGTRSFFDAACSGDKTKTEYDGWFHEIYNECEVDCDVQTDENGVTTNRALREVVDWLATKACMRPDSPRR